MSPIATILSASADTSSDAGPSSLCQRGGETLISRSDLSSGQRSALEELAWQHACVPESYDIAVSDGHLLRTPCERGAASVLVDGEYWHIAGSLLAPESLKPDMVDWLMRMSLAQNRTIAVYNVSQTDARLFQQAGFIVNKFGEEPILNPRHITWSGKPFEWVRRQSNYCVRAGVKIEEVTGIAQQQELADTLVSIMQQDLCGRTLDKPLRLLEGEFTPHALQRRRLFVARAADGAIDAFLACSPLDAGRSWAFETYRKRSQATRGVTAHLFRTVVDRMQSEGVEQISLCLIPGRNVRQAAIPAGDWRIERTLSLWFHRLDFVFNARGQDHFKSRFRPRYVDRYLCVAPRNTIGSLWSFLKTTGALNCNVRNLLKHLRQGLFK